MARPTKGTEIASLLLFAIEATHELQRIVQTVKEELRAPNPFLTLLGPSLSGVEERLEEGSSALKNDGHTQGLPSRKKLLELIGILERLSKWPATLIPTAGPFRRSHYSSLSSLIAGSHAASKSSIRRLATSTRAPEHRDKFHQSFTRFARTRCLRGPSLSDLITLGTKPFDDEYDACLHVLHETLDTISLQTEQCGGQFKANVALASIERMPDERDVTPFHIFFLHHHPDADSRAMWKEVRVRVLLQRGTSLVKFDAGDKRVSPEDFCGLVRRRQRGYLVFNAGNDGLAFEKIELNFDKLQRLYLLKASSVSLAMILEKRKLDDDDQLKLLLSYLLAKSIWQFYSTKWMARDWTKDSITFMRERLSGSSDQQQVITLLHKPHFIAELGSLQSPQPGRRRRVPTFEQDLLERFPSSTHIYPKILALGIMLLEIELGEGIERYRTEESLDPDEPPIENDDHYTAGSIIQSKAWERRNSFQAVKEIIEICLKPDTGKLGKDPDHVRENLYVYVVAPLGKLFRQAWSRDKEPEAFSPDHCISFSAAELPSEDQQLLYPNIISDVDPNAVPQSKAEPPEALVEDVNQGILALQSDTGQLYDDDDSDSLEARRKKTDDWFLNFIRYRYANNIEGQGLDTRLRVGILDSGIDLDHPFFDSEDRGRIKEMLSFIGDDPNDTPKGHGTHIAAIILHLTKNVDLYIGTVTNSSRVSNRKEVTNAINHARTKWKVDVLSLSFGFSDLKPTDGLADEIRNCIHDGIMVFSSSSNDGGEGSRTYPARLPGVISCYATNCHGTRSQINTPPEPHVSNFSFVGEEVRPIWPRKTAKVPERMRYKSGTSFATPVAVAIAALMIGYIEKKLPQKQWRIKPNSPEGIAKIFDLMKIRIDGYDWVSPTKYLSETDESKIKGDLQHYLGYRTT